MSTLTTNGYAVFTNGATLSFYASQFDNNAGNIFTSTTYNWTRDYLGNWYVNGEVDTNSLRFTEDGSITWSGYYEGGIGGANQTFNLSWPQIVKDDLTHHYLFYIERGGSGFGDQIRVKLYQDGQFVSSQVINNKPNLNAWFNIPFGVGSIASGPGTRVAITDSNGTYYRSYGQYLTPDYALGLMGQLWFGYFESEQLAIGNLWRNGYVDLGINGRLGALGEITPAFYNDFGYAGPNYVARTGLASSTQLVSTTKRLRTTSPQLRAVSTLRANVRNNSDYFARLYSTTQAVVNGGKLQQAESIQTVTSQLVAADVRIRNNASTMASNFTIYADLRRSGVNVQMDTSTTMTVTAQVNSSLQANLTTDSIIDANINRTTKGQAQLQSSSQLTVQASRLARAQSSMLAETFVQAQATAAIEAQAALLAETQLRANIADYNLVMSSTMTVQGNYVVNNTIDSRTASQLTAQGNYSVTGRANLTAFTSVLSLGNVKAKQIDSLLVNGETRWLVVHPETRLLQVDGETRRINALKI